MSRDQWIAVGGAVVLIIIVAAVFIVRAVLKKLSVMTTGEKVGFWLAPILSLVYAIFPLDVVPDALVGVGQIDDLTVLGGALFYVLRLLLKRRGGRKPGAAKTPETPAGKTS